MSQPWGLAGGEPGAVGENWLLPGGDETRAERLPDKCTIRIISDPDREPSMVQSGIVDAAATSDVLAGGDRRRRSDTGFLEAVAAQLK